MLVSDPIKPCPWSISVAETNSSNTPALNIQGKNSSLPAHRHKSFVIKTANSSIQAPAGIDPC